MSDRLVRFDADFGTSTNAVWVETVTHLHEQSLAPVSGKTTRDITLANARGEISETRTEAFIDGIWYTIARNRMTYNAEGKRTSLENLAGQVTATAWDGWSVTYNGENRPVLWECANIKLSIEGGVSYGAPSKARYS